MPDRWMACAFVSGLPHHVRQLLKASSRMDEMNLEQILTRARAIMTDDEGCQVLAAASIELPHSEAGAPLPNPLAEQLPATSTLDPTIWRKIVHKDVRRGQTGRRGLAATSGVFGAMALDTFPQNAREMPKGRRRQPQPSPRASKNPEVTHRTGICKWSRTHSPSGFGMLTNAGARLCVTAGGRKRWEC